MPDITMTPGPKEEKPLPMFREDLRLYVGPSDPDGSPTYNLFDPTRGQYFRISWTESLVFKFLRPGMTIPQLIAIIEANSTLKITPEEINTLFQDAVTNNLLRIHRTSEVVFDEAQKAKSGIFKWLLFHYLYIRIPLINPDKFLKRTLHYVLPLWSTPAITLYAILFLWGTFLLVTRFDEFLNTFPYFFTMGGAIAYGLGITSVKIIHEFSHAYTAKYYKIYVPTMGIALIVFWPVLYTDVTDSWKLAKRSRRLAISFAGIAAELVIAGIATLGWGLSSPGMFQSVCFIIASVTWISTLVINLNPALRFDGYYLLSDLWQIDNLQARTFAATRWQLRKWLLGLDLPPPEENLTPGRLAGMMVYSIYTWLYRLFLYTAIAIFIYKQFTKVLGIFLFFMEIGIFILWPLGWEVGQINRLRPYLTWNKRSVTTAVVTTLFLLWLLVPFPHRESYPAITIPHSEANQVLYVPYDSTVTAIYVKRNEQIQLEQPLVQLDSSTLLADIASNKIGLAAVDREIIIASQTEEDKALIAEKKANAEAMEAKIIGLERIQTELLLKAEVAGTLYQWDDTIKIGQTVARDAILGKIADLKHLQVIAFIPEMYISDVQNGDNVVFRRLRDMTKVNGKITQINPLRTMVLIYPQLASINHGDLPVAGVTPQGSTDKEAQMRLVESYYTALVTLDPIKEEFKIGETGYMDVRGPWRSYLMIFWKHLQSLFWQEGTI
ncbi:MAG: HlyD family efflux transporter periplasmic adaptor subunit [Parachlamydiaceae bacterium]|nr:HlyD family efflux transporter periplasmic adaptor subunit [Parachlamydiaceae bacterium]